MKSFIRKLHTLSYPLVCKSPFWIQNLWYIIGSRIYAGTNLLATRQRYRTHKTWLTFPAGTECWVERKDSKLILTFDDGQMVEAWGAFALGYESPKIPSGLVWLETVNFEILIVATSFV